MSLVLTRVDLATGELTTGTGQVALAADDPLAALGRWLTPSAAAKVLLSSGIALSPDGTRIYALGIASGGSADRLPGSAGLFVFDTASLAQVDHWNATADFVSIAVSADGKFVYAAGSPEMGADGSSTTQAASITVFDATDGSVRLLAGQLGHGFILFPSTILR
jgi:DNA-binding beta-propeller fold protein YncE